MAVQNAENGVVSGCLGGTQGHGQCHHSIGAYNFLFDFNRNHASVLYRFRDIAGYLSKVDDFDPPTCIWRPRRGLPRSNFAEIFGIRKLDSLRYRVVLFV